MLLGLVAAGLTLSACTGPGTTPAAGPTASQSDSAAASPSSSATPEPSTATPSASTKPAVRACYHLAFDDLTQATSTAAPVPCTAHHTSVTVAVLQHRNPDQVEKITDACSKAVRTYLGATKLQMATTMAHAVWFLPETSSETWVRCDLVLYASAGVLAPLPAKSKNLYSRSPDAIRTCSPTAPGTKKFARVLCTSDTPWRVLVALSVDGTSYPGAKKLQTDADFRCSDAVRLAKNLALTYTYGYEWPTKSQWKAGDHAIRCWTTG